jgi:hypothetical protein
MSELLCPQSSNGIPTVRRKAILAIDAVTGRLNEMHCANRCPARRYDQVWRQTITECSLVDSVRTSFDHHREWQHFPTQPPIDLNAISVTARFAANNRCGRIVLISFRLDRSQIDSRVRLVPIHQYGNTLRHEDNGLMTGRNCVTETNCSWGVAEWSHSCNDSYISCANDRHLK